MREKSNQAAAQQERKPDRMDGNDAGGLTEGRQRAWGRLVGMLRLPRAAAQPPQTRQRQALAVVAMLVIATVLAGCGSSSNNSAPREMAAIGNANTAASYDRVEMTDQYGGGSDEGMSFSTAAAPAGGAGRGEAGEAPAAAQMAVSTSGMTASPSSVAGSGGTSSVIGATDRKLIYNANVTMEVADYGQAQTELFDVIALSGGYLLSFNDNQTTYELGGVFTVKVPSDGFQSFLTQVEQLKKGDKFQRNVRAQDVTEEYVDLDSRLKAKQVVEERLLSFMDKATDTKDLLAFSNQLASEQEEIERLKGRMRYIDQNVAYSTVELRMYERLEGAKTLKDPDERGVRTGCGGDERSAAAIVAFFEGLIIVLAGALPILLVLAVIAIPLMVVYRKTRYKKGESPARPALGKGSRKTYGETVDSDQEPPRPSQPDEDSGDGDGQK